MPIIRTVQEQGSTAVQPADTSMIGSAVAGLGRQIVRVDEQIRNANRSRRVNEATTKMQSDILDFENTLPNDAFETNEITNTEFHKNLKSEFIKNAGSSEERDAITANFDQAALHSTSRVRQKSRGLSIDAGQAALENMHGVLSANYAVLTNDVDRQQLLDGYDAAINQAVSDGILPADGAQKLINSFINDAERLRASNDIAIDPEAALADINDGLYVLTEQDKQVIIGQANRAIASDIAAKNKIAAQAQQKIWTDLYDAVSQGTAGKADILKARATIIPGTALNHLSEQGTRSLLAQLKAKEKADKKSKDYSAIYQNSLLTGQALDQKNKDHRKAVDNAFIELAPELPNMMPDEANKRVVDEIIRPTKIIPDTLMGEMRIAAKMGKGPSVYKYSQLYSKIRRDPNTSGALLSMPPADEAFWSSISNLADAGVSLKDSIEMARHSAYEMTPDDRQAVKDSYRAHKYAEGTKLSFQKDVIDELAPQLDTSSVTSFLSSAWSKVVDDAPPVPPAMVADYNNLVKQYYILLPKNDIVEARKLAKEATLRAWISEDDGQ